MKTINCCMPATNYNTACFALVNHAEKAKHDFIVPTALLATIAVVAGTLATMSAVFMV